MDDGHRQQAHEDRFDDPVMMEVQAERLIVRPLRATDARDLFEYLSLTETDQFGPSLADHEASCIPSRMKRTRSARNWGPAAGWPIPSYSASCASGMPVAVARKSRGV